MFMRVLKYIGNWFRECWRDYWRLYHHQETDEEKQEAQTFQP
jgi:hypothetical protein